MISNAYVQSVHPRSDGTLPETALFHSTRGRIVAARAVGPNDAGLISALLAGLSAQSLFLRYCMPMPRMAPEAVAREAARLGQVHSAQQLTIVALATVGGVEQVVAVAELARDMDSPSVAELALVVADAYQREGIGSALCAYLVAAARRQGLAALRAMALAENVAVRRIISHSGALYKAETRQGMTAIQIDLGSQVGGWV